MAIQPRDRGPNASKWHPPAEEGWRLTSADAPYGSHLYWLYAWGWRINRYVQKEDERTKYDCFIFRPDELARNAMMWFATFPEYRYSIEQIESFLAPVEKRFATALRVEFDELATARLSRAMHELGDIVMRAGEIIATKERRREIAPETNSEPLPAWDAATEARNGWYYGQAIEGVDWETIKRRQGNKSKGWKKSFADRLESISQIRKNAIAFASRKKLPEIPARKRGRPPAS